MKRSVIPEKTKRTVVKREWPYHMHIYIYIVFTHVTSGHIGLLKQKKMFA